ncbi:hypothetical protein [Actinomadura fibrosa]|uniref:DUF222 domain-containing protein n=1 Tax=Actinomadura fibrosa TaxID=111802 RepID=A0ABW2XJL6_9ACTN|nr:hypothetical protein [Actinomadura fibrosa]
MTTPDSSTGNSTGDSKPVGGGLEVVSLADLVARAARWTAGTRRAAAQRTVVADVWDRMEWADIRANLEEVGDLIEDLAAEHDYADDLIADLWTVLFQDTPVQLDRDRVTPSRWVNHQIVASLLGCPQFMRLRAATVGDAFMAAHALTGQFVRLDDLLWAATAAQQDAAQADRAHAAAARAADQVLHAVWEAADSTDDHDHLPADALAAAQAAITAAENADTLAAAAAAAADRALDQAARSGLARGVWTLVTEAVDRLEAQQRLLDVWGIGADQLRRMDAADRAVLAERLRGNRMSEFADLIGRFRAFAHAEAAQKIIGGHGELVGTTLGSDIARAIPPKSPPSASRRCARCSWPASPRDACCPTKRAARNTSAAAP